MNAPIRNAYADTASGQLHCRRVDAAAAGDGAPPLILLHRTPASSACFEPMLQRLGAQRTAIAFDTPGFGMSFRPAGRPSAADYARWFLDAIDALGVPAFHLCAHHTGTHFAAELSWRAPDRVRSLLLSGVLHANADERAAMRAQIGVALQPDAAGRYLAATWSVLRSLDPVFEPALAHAEMLGALTAIEGRDQAFDAILAQDFPALLARLIERNACPIGIVQAEDDPLTGMLARVRHAHPSLPIELIGPAGMAAPERQPAAYARAALAFAAAHDSTHPTEHPS